MVDMAADARETTARQRANACGSEIKVIHAPIDDIHRPVRRD
jgi:hypothetical protein